jgi:hypothetical protein
MSLIERLERGPGSRELSDECLLAVGWTTAEVYLGGGLHGTRWYAPNGSSFGDNRPDPSQNLQDALDLMKPEGWSVKAYIHDDISHMSVYRLGEVKNLARDIAGGPHDGDAATPALGLSAASLRAGEAMKEEDGE